MNKGYIYKIISPTGRIYIGQTMDYIVRFKLYSQLACKSQTKLYRSLKKYGPINHSYEIIEECDIDLLNERETYYIALYNAASRRGLNCAVVADSPMRGRKHKASTKRKMSKVRKGVKKGPMSDSHKRALSLSRKEGFKSGTIIHPQLGKSFSEESKEKMRKAHTGKILTPEHKTAISKSLIGNTIRRDSLSKV